MRDMQRPAPPEDTGMEVVDPGIAFYAQGIIKTFDGNEVLHGIDLTVYAGELTVINGESGSGKSTLLHVLSGLDTPSSGQVVHAMTRLRGKTPNELADWRGNTIGFVFQDSNLMNGFSVGDNIVGPHELRGQQLDESWVAYLCETLGLEDKLSRDPATLSGGEKQRVALARALAHGPKVLFADEPTASLDSAHKYEIHDLLHQLVSETGLTVVLVSHDQVSGAYADRLVTMQDGAITSDIRPRTT